VSFDADLSEGRYELVNAMYDRLVTFRLKELNAAWKAIHDAEAKLGMLAPPVAQVLLRQARALASGVPITEKGASDPAIAGAFQEKKQDRPVAARQAEFERKWDDYATLNYAQALKKVDDALAAK
jgi:phosphoglycerate transport regulatory protein PgtC